MSKIIVPIGDGLYKKFSHCQFVPDSLEDPWREVRWQMKNKEDWCPLEPVREASGYSEPGF